MSCLQASCAARLFDEITELSSRRTKLQLDEEIRIVSNDPEAREVNGEIGAVVAFYEDERGRFHGEYGVHVYRTDEMWCFAERELVSLGTFDREENFVSDVTIRVDADGNILPGEGKLADRSGEDKETDAEDDGMTS